MPVLFAILVSTYVFVPIGTGISAKQSAQEAVIEVKFAGLPVHSGKAMLFPALPRNKPNTIRPGNSFFMRIE